METQKGQIKFRCKSCLYSCNSKYHWERHLLTTKHKKALLETKKGPLFECKICKKKFKSRSGIWKHRKKCRCQKKSTDLKRFLDKISKKQKILEETQEKNSKNIEKFSEKVEKKLDLLIEKSIIPVSKTVNNNNNISINVFLNEKCNNAINWKEFVDKMRVSLDDLMKTKQIGYAAGMTKIFIKNLEDLPTKERPIHCSDTKRLKFYVKDEDKWKKDSGEKMEAAIHKVSVRQIKKIKEWETVHPDFLSKKILTDEWHQLVLNTMGGSTDENREKAKNEIIKNVGSHVVLKTAIENSVDI